VPVDARHPRHEPRASDSWLEPEPARGAGASSRDPGKGGDAAGPDREPTRSQQQPVRREIAEHVLLFGRSVETDEAGSNPPMPQGPRRGPRGPRRSGDVGLEAAGADVGEELLAKARTAAADPERRPEAIVDRVLEAAEPCVDAEQGGIGTEAAASLGREDRRLCLRDPDLFPSRSRPR
jgi:hypothetical protein